jgi:hypothetical protein
LAADNARKNTGISLIDMNKEVRPRGWRHECAASRDLSG